MGRLISLVLVLGLWTHSTHLLADSTAIGTDSRIRIEAPSIYDKLIVGTIGWIQPDTLVLVPRIRIPLQAIERLEVSRGVDPIGHRVGSAAWKGALGLAGMAGYAAADDCRWDRSRCDGGKILAAIVGSALAGGFFGGLYGVLHTPERWSPVPPPLLRAYAPPNIR